MTSKLFYNLFRIVLGLVFLSSGIGKFYGTSGLIGPGWLFEELAKYQLLGFARFVALTQIVVGFMLLVRRFATLGAVVLLPVISCILVIVVSLKWQGTPAVNVVFLLMNLYLLYHDREKLFPILGIGQGYTFSRLLADTWMYLALLAFIVTGVMLSYYVDMRFKYVKTTALFGLLALGLYDWYRGRRQHTNP